VKDRTLGQTLVSLMVLTFVGEGCGKVSPRALSTPQPFTPQGRAPQHDAPKQLAFSKFMIEPSVIDPGQNSILRQSVRNASEMDIRPRVGKVDGIGQQQVSPSTSAVYGNLPLAFEPNVGQTDERVRFLARGRGMTAFFSDTETAIVLSRSQLTKKPAGPDRERAVEDESQQAVVRMKLAGASQARRATGLEKLPGVSNYFLGNDPAKWRADVPHYGRIAYEGVYPGIDLVWYGNQRRLEYDFVVAPGADPKQIQIAYEGVESLEVVAGGELVLRTALGEMRQQKPRVYQDLGGQRVEVGARYALVAGNRVSFELARYDRKRSWHDR
jgi:hypothetical protein